MKVNEGNPSFFSTLCLNRGHGRTPTQKKRVLCHYGEGGGGGKGRKRERESLQKEIECL